MANATPTIRGIKLVGTYQLPDRLRSIFKFPLFNAVQSKCFQAVFENDDNLVVSAPTGSGKTAILELAICRLSMNYQNQDFKIVYQAPTKSLCSERFNDWQTKFNHLGLKCAELTGDTDIYHLRQVHSADIIVTTPEKWDSVTRRWKDHRKLLDLVRLFLIDEVHILKEDRGASLEAVVSRMKSVGSNVRFIALSATVPNSEDIAAWLGANNRIPGMPAQREVFDESYRPVKLQKHVYGIQANGRNDFAFDQICNDQLPEVITKYSKQKKPIMVFCITRKSTEATALALATWWMDSPSHGRFWDSLSTPPQTDNQTLRKCMTAGVAFHHAGLTLPDRNAVESGYLKGQINVICCTSTLAVGVNLPCHLVIIKNTVSYQAEGCKEYSDLEVMQMLGRAGRPQFDDSAIAVIMTRVEKVDKYEKMVSGQETLESKFHLNLIEHLNAEVCLGTIHDIESARSWLKGTFLYVRLQKNSDHYKLLKAVSSRRIAEAVDEICHENLELLHQNQLLEKGKLFRATAFGDAMSRYYVQFDTMKLFLGLQPKAKISEILSALAQASEFKSLRFRSGEKPIFKALNESPSVKFPIQVDLSQSAHKVSLIIQTTLAGVDLRHDKQFANHAQQFQAEVAIVFQHVQRLIRCITDSQLELGDAVTLRNALDLSRSLGARAWEDSPLQMLQVENLGPVAVRKLAKASIRTVEELEDQDAQRVDMLLSRNPPFGNNLLQDLQKNFPKLRVSLKMLGKPKDWTCDQDLGITAEISAEVAFLNHSPPIQYRKKLIHVVVLVETSDGRIAHFARISAKSLGTGKTIRFNAKFTSHEQFITCYVSCDEIAGTQKQATLNPAVPASTFPRMERDKLRPALQLYDSNVWRDFKLKPNRGHDLDLDDIEDEDFFAAEEATTFGEADHRTTATGHTNLGKSNNRQDSDRYNENWTPIRLENGKWECQHLCKDKSSCKHFCCREGLDKPPNRPKRFSNTSSSAVPKQQTKIQSSMLGVPLAPKNLTNPSKIKESGNSPNISKRRVIDAPKINISNDFEFSDDFDDIDDICSDIPLQDLLREDQGKSSGKHSRQDLGPRNDNTRYPKMRTFENPISSTSMLSVNATKRRTSDIADGTVSKYCKRQHNSSQDILPTLKDVLKTTSTLKGSSNILKDDLDRSVTHSGRKDSKECGNFNSSGRLSQGDYESQSKAVEDTPEGSGVKVEAVSNKESRLDLPHVDDQSKEWLLKHFGDIFELV